MRILRFFGVFVLCAFVAMTNAVFADATFPADTPANYPVFDSRVQTVDGQTYPAGSIKDAKLKVATTNYVDTKVDGVAGSVTALGTSAATASTSVTANGTAIGAPASGNTAATGMFANRIDAPSGAGNTCPSTCGAGEDEPCECGYISAGGVNGTKQWIIIQ